MHHHASGQPSADAVGMTDLANHRRDKLLFHRHDEPLTGHFIGRVLQDARAAATVCPSRAGEVRQGVPKRTWNTRGGRAYWAKSRLATCSSTFARLRAPWSAAMKWLPIATEKAMRHRASSSSSSAQKGAS